MVDDTFQSRPTRDGALTKENEMRVGLKWAFATLVAGITAIIMWLPILMNTIDAFRVSENRSIGLMIGLLVLGLVVGTFVAVTVVGVVSITLELRLEYCFDCDCTCGDDPDDDDPEEDNQEFDEDPLQPGTMMYPTYPVLPRSA